jgi:hypothetical protein
MHQNGSEYQRGRQDAIDECTQRHIVRIADVLDAIDRHAGDVAALRAAVLGALGHGVL